MVRPKEMKKRLNISGATLWRMHSKYGLIPKPRQISLRCVGWSDSEADEMEERHKRGELANRLKTKTPR